jgi:hypothetical protein
MGAELDLSTLDGQDQNRDSFTDGQVNNAGFAGTAGDDKRGKVLLPDIR